jgi:Na+/phosphate symporter
VGAYRRNHWVHITGISNTDWQPEEEVSLSITGLDLERIYHNFVYQIAGNKLTKEPGRELAKAIEQNQEAEKIRNRIARLEDKMKKEIQFNLQLQLSAEIKALKKQLPDTT